MSEQDPVLFEQDDHVLKIQLNRPEKLNALTQEMYQSLYEALVNAEHNEDIRVILLYGCKQAFSAGNDLRDFVNYDPEQPLWVMPLLRQLVAMEKPMVAAVEGMAVGIGVTLLMHCDLVYAAENTQLRMPFVNLGVVPEAASSLILPRLMGHQRASELLLLGDFFSSDKARDYGLVNDVLPEGKVVDYALNKARHLASQPQKALWLSRKLMNKSWQDEIEERLGEEGMLFSQQLVSEETRTIIKQILK